MDDRQRDRDAGQADEAKLGQIVMPLQIIVAALLMGVLSFAAVAFFLGSKREADVARTPMLTYMSMAFAGVALILYFVVPGLIAARSSRALGRDASAAAYAPVFQTKTIVACALAEGAAFFALVAYIIEGNLLSYAVVGVMVVAMLFQVPTRSGIRDWCEGQLRNRNDMRSLERR